MSRMYSLLGNSQKLDGGAMFGNAPKALWARWVTVDEQNRIDLCCRALLVREDSGRNILFETGIGAFFEPRMRERYGVQESEHVLLASLAAHGLAAEDIDVVVLSHLHFDHAGGALKAWTPEAPMALAFPNARWVVGETAWERAVHPHPRDRASFIPGFTDLLAATGRVERVAGSQSQVLGEGYRFHTSDGHTPGMLLAEIATADGPLLFCADLIPGQPWVHVPITMGYDRNPEQLINEKQALLDEMVARGGRLFFTHDARVACGRVQKDDTGRFSVTGTQVSLDGETA